MIEQLKDRRGDLNRELDLARRYPNMHPYRDPAHVQALHDELAAIDGKLERVYQDIHADQLSKAAVRQATPAEREAIDRAHKALEHATAEAEAAVQSYAVKVRGAARGLFEAQSAAGERARYHIIWNQARNRLANAARQAFEN